MTNLALHLFFTIYLNISDSKSIQTLAKKLHIYIFYHARGVLRSRDGVTKMASVGHSSSHKQQDIQSSRYLTKAISLA